MGHLIIFFVTSLLSIAVIFLGIGAQKLHVAQMRECADLANEVRALREQIRVFERNQRIAQMIVVGGTEVTV